MRRIIERLRTMQIQVPIAMIIIGMLSFSTGWLSAIHLFDSQTAMAAPTVTLSSPPVIAPDDPVEFPDTFTEAEVMRWWISDRNPSLSPEAVDDIAYTVLQSAENWGNGIDPLLVLALIDAESECHPNARGSSSEVGLMQVIPSTGRWMARVHDVTYGEDVQKNILLGTMLLGDLFKMYGSYHATLTAYNRGEGGLKKWRAKYGTSQTPYSKSVVLRYNMLCKAFEKGKEYVQANRPTQILASAGIY